MEQISVTNPVSRAIEQVKQVLFRPFDLTKWITIGFCAWLAGLGEAGGGSSGFHGNSSNRTPTNFQQDLEHARSYVVENLAWIVPLAVFILVVIVAMTVLFLWLNSRGKFMFVYCVALNRAEVVTPWNHYRQLANSLFAFRLVLIGLNMLITLPLLAVMAMLGWPMLRDSAWNLAGIFGLAAIFLAMLAVGIFFVILRKLTTDFVVPLMYLRGSKCLAAWGEFRQMLASNFGGFVLYLLFQILLSLAIGIMLLIIIILTCCIAGCVLAIPFVGTVLLLPLLVFRRAYSLYYLAQYGPSYNVFLPVPAAA